MFMFETDLEQEGSLIHAEVEYGVSSDELFINSVRATSITTPDGETHPIIGSRPACKTTEVENSRLRNEAQEHFNRHNK